MFQHVLHLLVRDASAYVALIAAGGALLGGGLWLAGSHFSRSLMTLLAVLLGAWMGLQIPRWWPMPVQGWATATVGGLLLGLCGYGLHRACEGLGLAVTLAAWAGVAMLLHGGVAEWLPMPAENAAAVEYATGVWRAMADSQRQPAMAAAAGGIVVALILAVTLRRLAGYLFYSMLGVSMLVGFGLLAMSVGRPQLLALVPSRPMAQIMTLGAMVIFGALVQWRTSPSPAKTAPAKEPK